MVGGLDPTYESDFDLDLRITKAIGPEGGIAPEEMEQLTALGGKPITLGKRILRTETAGLAALSVFFGLYGEME